MRVLLRIAYDGSNYSGWQIQPNAVTVEGELQKALNHLFGGEVPMIGASRTDAGVHAYGNVAVIDVNTLIPAEKIPYAINAGLPGDIRIQGAAVVPDDFHPRHTDCVKKYRYSIWNDTFENPMGRLYMNFVYGNLNVDSMNEAAKAFVGTHDFSSFCAAGSQVEDKTRTIFSLDVIRSGSRIDIEVTGNGFLYNMVRIIAGTLIRVGQGCLQADDIPKIIEGKNRQLAGPTAPARGLALVEIKYKDIES